MDKTTIKQQIVSQRVDEHGVVKEEYTTTTLTLEREPDYVKLYIKDVLRLTDIPNSGNSILFCILKRMSYNSEIALFAPVKKGIALELGISEPTVSKAIELFANRSILLRIDRGLYVVNPFFFGRGKWEDIKKVRISIVYSENGRMIIKPEISEDNPVKNFEENAVKVKDSEENLVLLEKKNELIKSLNAVENEMLKNTEKSVKAA